MGWNKEFHTVKAMYLSEYPVIGVVTETRIRYGGSIQHELKLKEPLWMPWSDVDDEPRTTVLVNDKQIVHDFGIIV